MSKRVGSFRTSFRSIIWCASWSAQCLSDHNERRQGATRCALVTEPLLANRVTYFQIAERALPCTVSLTLLMPVDRARNAICVLGDHLLACLEARHDLRYQW
jgi:hypothetical protein